MVVLAASAMDGLLEVVFRHSDISELFDLPEGQRLVILAGTDQHLTGSDRFRLGLEAIHPGRSGILDAYATTRNRPKATAARAAGP